MHQEIHKKSLLYTLKENRIKVKTFTKYLIVFSISVCIILLLLSIKQETQTYLFITIPIVIYILYASYKIVSIWQIHKKIKQKIKSL